MLALELRSQSLYSYNFENSSLLSQTNYALEFISEMLDREHEFSGILLCNLELLMEAISSVLFQSRAKPMSSEIQF